MRSGPELVCCQNEKHIGRHFLEHLVQPDVLERHSNSQQIHDHPRKINVADNHQVKVVEKLQLFKVDCGFFRGTRSFLEVTDRPDHGKHDAAAAEEIDEDEDISPRVVFTCT